MSWGMTIDEVMQALEAHWEGEAAEFNSGWRELQRLLDRIRRGAAAGDRPALITPFIVAPPCPLSGKPDIGADMAVGPLLTDPVEKVFVNNDES
jgi:hypothetical protein